MPDLNDFSPDMEWAESDEGVEKDEKSFLERTFWHHVQFQFFSFGIGTDYSIAKRV